MADRLENADHIRHLPFPGTHNFRDIGGYATEDGGVTRWRTLFRSDSLHRLNQDAQREIVALGVRTVVDLRHVSEVERLPNAFAASDDVRYLHLPMVPFPSVKRIAESLEELNLIWLDHCQEQLRDIIGGIAGEDTFPSVVHCAIGKDRTGLVVALLLRLAGVPHEAVVQDYALSGIYAAPAIAEYRQHMLDNGGDPAKFLPMLECRAEVMEITLEHLDRTYGGIHDYIARIGLPYPAVDALRSALVEHDATRISPRQA